ncbi:hypothetical protein RclHR1_00800007 [Rhizophagus clarus]|nr:hypothetical protein RclHR1_00800007 [Rhizophagus clarus]
MDKILKQIIPKEKEASLSPDTVVDTISAYRKNLPFDNTIKNQSPVKSENEYQIYGFAEVMTYHKEAMNAIRYSNSHGGRIPARDEKDDVWWETLDEVK